jgi:hypothetical protein
VLVLGYHCYGTAEPQLGSSVTCRGNPLVVMIVYIWCV